MIFFETYFHIRRISTKIPRQLQAAAEKKKHLTIRRCICRHGMFHPPPLPAPGDGRKDTCGLVEMNNRQEIFAEAEKKGPKMSMPVSPER